MLTKTVCSISVCTNPKGVRKFRTDLNAHYFDDLLSSERQKRPSIEAKETYYRGKRDPLLIEYVSDQTCLQKEEILCRVPSRPDVCLLVQERMRFEEAHLQLVCPPLKVGILKGEVGIIAEFRDRLEDSQR